VIAEETAKVHVKHIMELDSHVCTEPLRSLSGVESSHREPITPASTGFVLVPRRGEEKRSML
jgi:hypothetical protein